MQLISIGSVPIQAVYERQLKSSSYGNPALTPKLINSSFPLFYQVYYGIKDSFAVEVKDKSRIKTLSIRALDGLAVEKELAKIEGNEE